jgi:hypothetical protein
MKKESDNKTPGYLPDNEEKTDFLEYNLYPASEDIYNKNKEEINIDPEDISKVKQSSIDNEPVSDNTNDFNDNESGSDLDIPGSESDDDQEVVGSEDEENNYYSIGGDDHNELDEDKNEL